ncbi:cupredoxin domain-containing protein [Paenibacillus sp. strain BS8-2]
MMKLNFSKLCMALALIALLTLSACGNSNDNNTGSPSDSTKAPAGGGATKEITINAVNWSFNEPEIKASVGDTLKITLVNEKGVHALQSDDLNLTINGGESATITLDKAGTYEFHCSIQCGQGHDNMVGQIIVE